MQRQLSERLFAQARERMPGGVNSPVRAFRHLGITPPVIRSARGARMTDVDGNEYIDYVGSWGPMILGHAHPEIVAAIQNAAESGTSFGALSEREITMAELICAAVPSIEMVRLVNSGTEAVMSALRLARGFTGRNKILKFEGCYHGHSDALLSKAGSGLLTLGLPDSAGVAAETTRDTLTVPYNDGAAVAEAFRAYGNELAAVIVEPIAGNMGLVPPQPEFLRLLRELTQRYGVLLVFDEVITGFRVAYGGAQGYYGVTPDLTVLGKIIGGGLPVGAYGGRREIMQLVAPSGPVYQAGTLSGNPVALAAGIQMLQILRDNPAVYREIEQKAARLEQAFQGAAAKYHLPLQVNRAGSLLCAFFAETPVVDYRTAQCSDTARFAAYCRGMLERGIYLPPSQFEAIFVSAAHQETDLSATVAAIEVTLAEISRGE